MQIRNILNYTINDFIFFSKRVKADIFWVTDKNERNKDDMRKKWAYKKMRLFNLQGIIFYKNIFKMYILADLNEILENQDL